MVANLSAHKRGWDDRWEDFSDWAGTGKHYHEALLRCVDEDTAALNKIMEAFGLPKNTELKKPPEKGYSEATKTAIEVPLK